MLGPQDSSAWGLQVRQPSRSRQTHSLAAIGWDDMRRLRQTQGQAWDQRSLWMRRITGHWPVGVAMR
jgi:hypothetical protein